MKAAILKGIRDILCEEIERPAIEPDEVLIKVQYCGICGSDIHGYQEGLFPPGTVMGHEFSGEVSEVGAEVEGLTSGDRVTVNPASLCGKCRWCRRGQYSLCPTAMLKGVGLGQWQGAMAEYVRAKAYQVWKLPPEISYQQGAVTEPLAVALHAVRSSGLSLGQSVLIMGAGTIGLLVMQVARKAGAGKLLITEVARKRLALAEELGAHYLFNPLKDDLRQIKKLTDGGPDMIYECSGSPEALNEALSLISRGGKIMLVGMSMKPVTLSHMHIMQKELTLQASLCYSDDFQYALFMVADGSINVSSLVTNIAPLDNVRDAFEERVKAENSVKVLLEP